MKRTFVVFLSVFLGVALSSLAFAQGPKLKIVAISKSINNPAFQAAKIGAMDRAKELGDVDIEFTAPTSSDASLEVQMIEAYIGKKVDGLLVNSLGPSVDTAINEAMDAGIPVLTWDSDAPNSKRIAYVGSDNYAGGYEAGKLYAEATKGKGPQTIAILTGTPGAFNLQQRDQGFTDALKALGVDFTIATNVPCFEDLEKSVEAVESTLRGNSKINGFYFDGPWSLLVDPTNLPTMALKVKAGQLTVVSYDTLQAELQYVDKGLVYGLVGQKYYAWGYQGVTVFEQILKHDAKYPPIVNTGADTVTKAGGKGRYTSQQFNKFWKSFSFKEKPLMPSDVK